jgi:hypothetical protein
MAGKKKKAAKKKRAKTKKKKAASRRIVSVPVQQLPAQPEPETTIQSAKSIASGALKAAEDIVGFVVDGATWPTRLAIEGFKSSAANAQKKTKDEPEAIAS